MEGGEGGVDLGGRVGVRVVGGGECVVVMGGVRDGGFVGSGCG